jgi:two-component system phosphate regulon sensor histidine kinase PhoR
LKRRKLFWRLFPSLWVIAALALIAVTIYFSHTLEKFYIDQAVLDLKNKAIIIRNVASDELFAIGNNYDVGICNNLMKGTEIRLTVVSKTGEVLCDSEKNPQFLENHADRPEIKKALGGETGISIRFSQTINVDLVYVAVPVYRDSNIIGVIRLAISIASIHDALSEVYWRVALGSLAFILLTIFTSMLISRRVTAPLDSMSKVAERFSQGELQYRLPDQDSVEIGGLADSMNSMAAQLDDRISTIIRQRNEQQAVLQSMVEGVMAVDLDERIIDLNSAAENMLDISSQEASGKFIHEVIRNIDIQNFVKKVLVARETIEGEFVISRGKDIYLQAHGTILKDAGDEHIGAVIVFNDITRIRQLENVRKDFVANVSHELRTPITSIKGFVETLREGAIDDPDDARRFLDIIVKQANRLNGIIEDLLSLSRIEEKEEKAEIELGRHKLKPVLEASIHACSTLSSENGIEIDLICDKDLEAMINPDLLQQAVVNLLDNAIKYSFAGDVVTIETKKDTNSIRIAVIDKGIGIPKEHHDHLFERFYRVDKERSRKLGGTGLGLAIVKHIVHAHHGRVSVDSEPGKGSTFTITLPLA